MHSLGIVHWNSTRRDHPGNPGGVSGSGPVTWATLFHPIFNEDEWPLYDVTTIVPPESMQRIGSGRPKSTRLPNEMDVREGKTPITCGLCK